MTDPDPTLRAAPLPEDQSPDRALRPQDLSEFIGQEEARANLGVFIESARRRGEAMDHVLFHGPPGLGKTTLAQIMARELGVNFRMTSGPVLAKAGDLAAILTNLEARDVLFIDEIHRLNPAVEEVLYPALEDFELDLVIGEGPAARTVRIELQPFTLVGATTRLGLLTTPLRDRFGIPTRLQFYTVPELHEIVTRGARMLGIPSDPEGALEIARRARGTPRIAGRLLRRVVDFALVEGDGRLTLAIADSALTRLGVDHLGLDGADRRYLTLVAEAYQGGPVGIETMAAALSESRDALEEVIEPFLLQQGLIQRTPRGRMLAAAAWRHLGIAPPPAGRRRAGPVRGGYMKLDAFEPLTEAERAVIAGLGTGHVTVLGDGTLPGAEAGEDRQVRASLIRWLALGAPGDDTVRLHEKGLRIGAALVLSDGQADPVLGHEVNAGARPRELFTRP